MSRASEPQSCCSVGRNQGETQISSLPYRIRKGFPCEARVVARILPQFLDDFFPPQDVMNKVIGEFLSNQQPYPQFMATVVYKVRVSMCGTRTEQGVESRIISTLPVGLSSGLDSSCKKGGSCSPCHSIPTPPHPPPQPDLCSGFSHLQVFQTLHSAGQSSMVRDWVMLSLSNFTQRTPVAMAMWSLSCFLVSASTSPWVSAMYPSMGL